MNRHRFLEFSRLAMALLALMVLLGPAGSFAAPITAPGTVPDYFETPNWAFSPPLRKFVDTLAPLGCASTNNLGQCIPIATPDILTYPGSDYYEIELVQYREQMHSDLPALNGTPSTASSGGTMIRGYRQINNGTNQAGTANDVSPEAEPHYLGPIIIAQKNRPVRVKFINNLPTNADGNLFVPVDTSIMGSGPFEIDYDPETKAPTSLVSGDFAQNRATLHLHGGRTPWISDGTPHQWVTPAGETTAYPKGVSVAYVPDMWFDASGNTITDCAGSTTCNVPGASNNPGPGMQTFYWTNQQSARLLFYHDHAWGITRLNVYVGEAAGYLIQDPVELAMVNGGSVGGRTYEAGTIPADQIPLVIEDKTFVDADTIAASDPTWAWGSTAPTPFAGSPTTVGQGMNPVTGDLWWPHVYMPAENPFSPDGTGVAPLGRWVYGPWFFPPTPTCGTTPDAVKPFCVDFGPVPNPYYDPNCVPDPVENNNFCQPPEIPGTPNVSWGAEAFLDTMTVNGTVFPTVTLDAKPYRFRILNADHDRFVNLQLYLADSSVTIPADCPTCVANTEVRMVPAATTAGFPNGWPADGREGGVPDPNYRGPAWIQIGSEGGFLPEPVVLPNRPILWNTDVTLFNAGNVLQQNEGGGTLFLGPAERADVIVDFSQFAGKTLILYNDAPAPWPALDPHYDFYTNNPDRTDIGGSPSTPVGRGPNVRTVMQIKVNGSGGSAIPDYYNPTTLAKLQTAFSTSPDAGIPGTPGAFQSGQDPIVVGQSFYNTTYNTTFPSTYPLWGKSRISDNSISFKDLDGITVRNLPMQPKAIHDEMGASFDDFGRLSAKLGLEVPFTNAAISTFVLQNYVDPSTEIVQPDGVQIWRVTHNGVDTHPIHFHLFDVQVLNRVGWDGFIRDPDPNEIGWKDTVRISPLEDTIVALRPIKPTVPFTLPDSIRPLNPAFPLHSTNGFSQIDPLTGGPVNTPTTNELTNLGHEYVWHCHILSHEENDMMRVIVFEQPATVPAAPILATPAVDVQKVSLSWTQLSNASNEPSGFRVERSDAGGPFASLANIRYSNILTYDDTTVAPSTQYAYRVVAFNTLGDSTASNTQTITTGTWTAPSVTLTSPTDGAAFLPGDTIPLAATVTPGGGTITKVEFYYGGILISTDTSSPYSRNWTSVPAGTYPLTAKAYDSLGATAVSAPVTVTISATAALNVTPASAAFGDVALSVTSTPATFTIANNGATGLDLTVTGIALSGADASLFQIGTGTCGSLTPTIAVGNSCTFTVTFTPTTIGAKSASVTVSASGELPVNLPLTGNGVSTAAISPTSLSFGNVAVNFTATPQQVTVTNNGSSGLSMTINAIGLSGADQAMYQIINGSCGTLPASLAVGSSCYFTVSFTPTSGALKSASADVTISGEPTVGIALTGTGINATNPVRMTAPSSNFFSSLSSAFASATGNATLQAWGTVLPATTLNVSSTGTVNFSGGYDTLFSTRNSITTMQGVLTIQQGALVVDGLSIQ